MMATTNNTTTSRRVVHKGRPPTGVTEQITVHLTKRNVKKIHEVVRAIRERTGRENVSLSEAVRYILEMV